MRIGACVLVGALVVPAALALTEKADLPRSSLPELTVISGKPRERGRQYGKTFKKEVRAVRGRFFGKVLTPGSAARTKVLDHARACAHEIRRYSPTVTQELEGIAEGAEIPLEEVVLINCHE